MNAKKPGATTPVARKATRSRGTAKAATGSQLEQIRSRVKNGPIIGQPIVRHFEVRTPWVRIALKTLAEHVEDLNALPPVGFQGLGKVVALGCYAAAREMKSGTDRRKSSQTYWLKTRAEDYTRIKRSRLAEIEIVMTESDWLLVKVIAQRLEVPADALISSQLGGRVYGIRKRRQEEAAAITCSQKGGAK